MPEVTLNTTARTPDGRIKTLEDLLRETQVDTTKWAVERFTVNKWDGPIASGVIGEFFQVKANLKRFPALDLVPASAELPVVVGTTLNISKETELAVFLPDFQIGYEWNESYTYLDPSMIVQLWKLAYSLFAMYSQITYSAWVIF